MLSRPADRITIAEIFKAFDEPRAMGASPAGASVTSKADSAAMPNTEALRDSLRSTVLLFLGGVSLAEVAAGRAREVRDHLRFAHRHGTDLPGTGKEAPAAESRA